MPIQHRIVPALSNNDVLRFWRKVEIHSPDKCWPWKATPGNGYGFFGVGKKNFVANRIAYAITKATPPVGIEVCHTCDNTLCCNPAHLFLGTRLDNMRDMAAKGRGWGGKGEKNPNAKLKAKDVAEIRRAYGAGEASQYALARRFGVTRPMIGYIVRGDHWRNP